MIRFLLLPILLVLAFSSASANENQPIHGKVVGISDGDTITVYNGKDELIRVRLANIDAPEKKQDFGMQAKKSLSDICYMKEADIYIRNYDRYGRVVADVYCDGSHANEIQVKRGMAWVYRQYNKDSSLLRLENEARKYRVGLWSYPNPTPPWEWRKLKK